MREMPWRAVCRARGWVSPHWRTGRDCRHRGASGQAGGGAAVGLESGKKMCGMEAAAMRESDGRARRERTSWWLSGVRPGDLVVV